MYAYLKGSSFTIDVLTLLVLASMVVSILQNKRPAPDYAPPFFWMLVLGLSQTVVNILSTLAYIERSRVFLYLASWLNYSLGYGVTFSFCVFLYRLCRDPEKDTWLWRDVVCFAGIGYIVQIVAVCILTWQGKLFGLPRDSGMLNVVQRVLILYGFTLAVLVVNSFVVISRRMPLQKKVILCLYCLIPLAAIPTMLTGARRNASFLLVQTVLLYCHIFVIQGKDLVETEAELNNSRMETMLSQIQPHFLYNALSSCVSLCDEDPQKAKQTLLDFSRYLRSNLDSLGKKEPIPFMKELEHTRTYLNIEQIRFGDKVKVEYDLQDTDFLLPALSLQPLAENAVKHGITMKRNGGTVKISTRSDEKNWYVIVEDDGVGFEKLPEGREHIGVRNIQGRLSSMVGGSLKYESQINIGTKAVITLPRKGK